MAPLELAPPDGPLSSSSATRMVARCPLLILLVSCLGNAWVLEQPKTSIMDLHDTLQWLQELSIMFPDWLRWIIVDSYMGAYNASTMKPTKFYTNRPWLYALARQRPKNSFTTTVVDKQVKNGKSSVSGKPNLKSTQAYTSEFGHSVLDAYVFSCMDQHACPDPIESDSDLDAEAPEGVWELAGLDEVILFTKRS